MVEWRLHLKGTDQVRDFELWIDQSGTDQMTFAYAPATLGADAAGLPLAIGAENFDGTLGAHLDGPPAGDLLVTTRPEVPGGNVSYSLTVRGRREGLGTVTSWLSSPALPGVATSQAGVVVTPRR